MVTPRTNRKEQLSALTQGDTDRKALARLTRPVTNFPGNVGRGRTRQRRIRVGMPLLTASSLRAGFGHKYARLLRLLKFSLRS